MNTEAKSCLHGTRWPHECKECADEPTEAQISAFMASQATARTELVSMWLHERNPKIQRRVGKTVEEASELIKVCARIQIQGLHGVDPTTGKTNIDALTEEIADVMAQCNVSVEALKLDRAAIAARVARKELIMVQWEALIDSAGVEG